MAAVRAVDTMPELVVRRALHAKGYRFRLNRIDLPGKPDIVLPKYKACIFVHGCFWHRHPGCERATLPATNVDFWRQKLNRNVKRDEEVVSSLIEMGWRVFVLWECETRPPELLERQLSEILKKFVGAVNKQ